MIEDVTPSQNTPAHLTYLLEIPPSDSATSFAIILTPGNLGKRGGHYYICDLNSSAIYYNPVTAIKCKVFRPLAQVQIKSNLN